jgi:hypothetical protein
MKECFAIGWPAKEVLNYFTSQGGFAGLLHIIYLQGIEFLATSASTQDLVTV